nr:hypothetical protein [Burkholderia metallica]
MRIEKPLWHEGLILTQQHFQQQDRQVGFALDQYVSTATAQTDPPSAGMRCRLPRPVRDRQARPVPARLSADSDDVGSDDGLQRLDRPGGAASLASEAFNLVAGLPNSQQGEGQVDPECHPFLLAVDAILQPPVLRAVRHNLDMHALAVGQLVGLFAGLGRTAIDIGKGHLSMVAFRCRGSENPPPAMPARFRGVNGKRWQQKAP